MDGSYRVVRLDDVDAGEDYGGLRFKPVRTLLGIEAFGVAAWVAAAGEPVVSEHTETADAALAHLDAALAILPRLRAHAQADSDLDSIRDDPRFPAAAA